MPDIFVSQNKPLQTDINLKKENDVRGDLDLKPKIGNRSPQNVHTLPNHTHNPLAWFYYYPDKVNFVNREPKEKVILLLRAHPITNLHWIFITIIMTLAPIFFLFFPFFEKLPGAYQNVLVIIWYMITFAFAFEQFLIWFFHVNIVTDERIIEVDFVSLFAREITDANIDQIQDVTSQIIGGAWTFFNFGNVIIQTAAEIPRITFERVPRPDDVTKVLRELRVEEEVEKLEGRVR